MCKLFFLQKTQTVAIWNKAEILNCIQILKILLSDYSAVITYVQRHSQSLDVVPLLLYRWHRLNNLFSTPHVCVKFCEPCGIFNPAASSGCGAMILHSCSWSRKNGFLKWWNNEATCGGSSRWCQAWMRLSMIPSPNNPASTVSVTTKDTL